MTAIRERARAVARRLMAAGHEAWFAGGSVRDVLLGREPLDWDIATSARPEQVASLFRRTVGVGKSFGVMVVLDGPHAFQVATFRADGAYGDGRRPDSVRFTDAREDVLRRDFTINGLLMHPVTDEIVDHVGGRADLAARLVRTIGDPRQRFGEDHLRLLRAVRFAVRLGFDIEAETATALRDLRDHAARPSAERVGAELDKMFTERDPASALDWLERLDLLAVVLPEVAARVQRPIENRLGVKGVADSLARARALLLSLALNEVEPVIVWAILADDLVADDGSRARARAATALLRRLRLANDRIEAVAELVSLRDSMLFSTRPGAARVARCAVQPDADRRSLFRRVQARVARATAPCVFPAPSQSLPAPLLDGRRLMALGVPPGRALGRWVKMLRVLQLSSRLKDELGAEDWVRERLNRFSRGG